MSGLFMRYAQRSSVSRWTEQSPAGLFDCKIDEATPSWGSSWFGEPRTPPMKKGARGGRYSTMLHQISSVNRQSVTRDLFDQGRAELALEQRGGIGRFDRCFEETLLVEFHRL